MTRTSLLFITLLGALTCLAACSGDDNNDANDDTQDMGATQDAGVVTDTGLTSDSGVVDSGTTLDGGTAEGSTSGVLCTHQGSGMQQLIYTQMDPRTGTLSNIDETLAYEFAWSCDATERTMTGNGVPNHAVTGGEFASKVSAQSVGMTVTLTPAIAAQPTTVKEPGYALNSIKFDPGTAGTCPDDSAGVEDCDPGAGSDMWSMVATPGDVSPWKFGFGVDENDAHVQPTGQYHYHGDPVNLVKDLNSDFETSMTLIGWATDGFPIYSIYGVSDVNDATSSVVKMTSSYRTVDTPATGRPDISVFALGHFEQDWQYVEGSGSLDRCNGRFAATPEFPDGIYHYYTTETYPFVQRCVSGTSAAGAGGPGGMMGGGPGGMMGGM